MKSAVEHTLLCSTVTVAFGWKQDNLKLSVKRQMPSCVHMYLWLALNTQLSRCKLSSLRTPIYRTHGCSTFGKRVCLEWRSLTAIVMGSDPRIWLKDAWHEAIARGRSQAPPSEGFTRSGVRELINACYSCSRVCGYSYGSAVDGAGWLTCSWLFRALKARRRKYYLGEFLDPKRIGIFRQK